MENLVLWNYNRSVLCFGGEMAFFLSLFSLHLLSKFWLWKFQKKKGVKG